MIKYIKYRDPRTGKIGYIRKNDAQLKSKSGSYGDHGNIFKTWWKYLTSNSNKIQKQTQNFDTNAYVKRKNAQYGKRRNSAIELLDFINTGGNKNRGKKINPTATVRGTYQRPTQDARTSQDRFQQSQYKKNTPVRKKQTVQRQQPITKDYQLDDVVITAKKPVKKTQSTRTASISNSYNTPVRKRSVRRVEREEPLPLLNNPNYINDNDVRGIQFIPYNFDGYDNLLEIFNKKCLKIINSKKSNYKKASFVDILSIIGFIIVFLIFVISIVYSRFQDLNLIEDKKIFISIIILGIGFALTFPKNLKNYKKNEHLSSVDLKGLIISLSGFLFIILGFWKLFK